MASPALPATMRASYWSAPCSKGLDKALALNASTPLPKGADALPAGSVLVKVAYASLNPVDYKIPETPLVRNFFLPKGIPCSDFSGTVVASAVDRLKVGQEVFGYMDLPAFGACAEYVVAIDKNTVAVPAGVSLAHAATLGVAGLTAYQTLAPFVKPGDKVLVNGGSGGVGTFTIQIAKALGCYVTATCSGANVELCKSLGADEVIDYRTENVVQALARKGTAYDLLVDNVLSSPELYFGCHKYLKPAAKYVTIAGGPSLPFIRDILSIYLWPAFLGGGQRKFDFVTCTANVQQWETIAQWVQEGKVKVSIEKTYDLAETGQAFERLKSGRTRGKIIIKVT